MDERTRRLLKNTVLVNEMFIADFHTVSGAVALLSSKWKGEWYENNEAWELMWSGSHLLASYLDSIVVTTRRIGR